MSIDAKEILNLAERIKQEIVVDRRMLHKNPEVGVCLPKTKEYVKERLVEMGYTPVEICESGIVAEVSGKSSDGCIMLRADMDALDMSEATDLDFKSENGNMHACGHDMHTAMLLGAAKLLKEFQSEINGTVKLVFQSDEEGFTGAKSMIEAGVLEKPAPEAALALHVHSGTPSGLLLCGKGTFMSGCTLFQITVKGIGCHGAMPETGVDSINIAAHIYLSLQEITAREITAKKPVVISVGKFRGGNLPNIIPQETVIEGTIRTFDRELSEEIFSRIAEISESVASAFRGSAVVEKLSSAPPLINNPELTAQMADYVSELLGEKSVYMLNEGGMGSEDFAAYTYKIPCVYMLLGAGAREENPLFGYPMHNERVIFNEDILPIGAAVHTYCALKWLDGFK